MYIVREIFRLKFGHYRDVKALIDEALNKKMFPQTNQSRMLTDFTGPSYRMILESGFEALGDFEKSLQTEMTAGNWNEWYHRFKQHVESSEREILKIV
ncbi:MAG TPA: hypothetical protein PKD91_10180 [Bacteroidia bacterium]|nr:hypothetical protein [Bacteroidia bacterium]